MTEYCCQDGRPVSHAHQLLNHVVDCIAARKPQALFAEYPVSPTSYDRGFMRIRYKTLANAVDYFAWFLVDNLGPGCDFETLAYIGPNDLVYPSLILGAVKAGYKALLLSPRNSIEAQLHVLQTTKCKTFLVPEPCPPPVAAVLAALGDPVRVIRVPSVQQLVEARPTPFIYDISYEEAKNTPLMVLHSSGSTGLPQARVLSQYFMASFAQQIQLTPPPGYESFDKLYQGNRVFVLAPPFHGAYIAQMMNAITSGSALIHPLTGAIPSAASLVEAIKYTNVDVAAVVPVMLEEMSRSPELLDEVASRMETLFFAGGAVPQACGDMIASRIRLVSLWGSTETGAYSLLCPLQDQQPDDWRYLSFHPKAGADFRHYADDKYELTLSRRPELEGLQPVFIAFPELQEWRTRDLFRRHPSKPNMWSHCGRADDTIVLITGEKIAPTDMEQYILSQHAEISGVIIAGAQRFQPSLLIELHDDNKMSHDSVTDLVIRFWPSIEKANESLPAHAQITKSHVLILNPGQSFCRTAKGSVQRNATMAQYANELDVLYNDADQINDSATSNKTCDLHDTEETTKCVSSIVNTLTGQPLGDNENFFVQGMDSLQALRLFREMKRQIPFIPQFDIRIVYAYPTIRLLVAALQKLAIDSSVSQSITTTLSVDDINSTIAKFCERIDKIRISNRNTSSQQGPPVYIVTGSTGSLGSYVLASLLKSDAAHIYCLNRSSNSRVIQLKKHAKQGLPTDLPPSRVTFLTVDISSPNFNIDSTTFSKLTQTVTHIIHNAWTVNFNLPLSFYSPQIQGVVNLVRFCTLTHHSSSLLYVSSTGAIARPSHPLVPEHIIDEPSAATVMGYGASKYISEHLLNHAARRLGSAIVIKIARLGQIAGPLQGSGVWNKSEWLPSIMRSSALLGVLPDSLGAELDHIDWLPVDTMGDILLELSQDRDSMHHDSHANHRNGTNGVMTGARVFNIVNPHVLSWNQLLPDITRTLSSLPACKTADPTSDTKIEIVPFLDWIRHVRSAFDAQKSPSTAVSTSQTVSAEDESANPAAKLLGFYEDAYKLVPREWKTDAARRASPALDSVGAIRGEWVDRWIRAWF